MSKTKKYKLVDSDGYTRRSQSGETYWLDGKEKSVTGTGKEMCSADIIHYYDHPLLAVLFNPLHANIENPRLIEIEIDAKVAHDGLKGGCKKAKHLREIELPIITIEQIVTFAIQISLKYYKDSAYKKWAEKWLNGEDRRAESAASAARAAEWDASAAESAARAAEWAARAAVWAARAAEWAARVAESAARAVWAARAAEWAARAERAEKINKLFTKTIKAICTKT